MSTERSDIRKVLFVTAIRSDYDILAAVIRAVDEHPALRAQVVISGTHLAPLYGSTWREVEADGFEIVARLENLLNSDSAAGRVKSAAIQLMGLVDVLVQQQPDIIVAPMDREEAITVALAGAYLRIPVAHLGGGDRGEDGNIDNAVRDAVSKLAHLHLVTTEQSAARLREIGEADWRIHVVGAPGLDRLLATPDLADSELWRQVGFDPGGQPFALVIQHPLIDSIEQSGALMRETLESLRQLQLPALLSYPNSDAGGQQIIAVIEEYAGRYPELFRPYRNLPRLVFVNLLRRAHVLLGNSSCGIIEAPLLGLPVVNIGPRQRGREHAENVQFVAHDRKQIRAAVERALFDAEYRRQVAECRNPYGDGQAGRRIAELLANCALDARLIYKRNLPA